MVIEQAVITSNRRALQVSRILLSIEHESMEQQTNLSFVTTTTFFDLGAHTISGTNK